ncbi:MAG: hypothetical protein Q8N05_11990, partial [Bacteroidota bacterium]|nr:hypothetical protein [Bacteroidota bacterium]
SFSTVYFLLNAVSISISNLLIPYCSFIQRYKIRTKIRSNILTFFTPHLTGYAGIEIKKGDSILFKYSSVGGGIEPLEYQWQPRTGLSNPDSLVTWCKPNSTTQYDIIVTDSCGCVSYPNTVYYIMVLPTGLNEVKNDKDNLLNIRQNGKLIYFNNPYKQEAHITLYSINGEAKYNLTITEDHFKIGNLLKIKGICIAKISVGELTGSSKFINL